MFVPTICTSHWSERYRSSWRLGLWRKLVSPKPSALAAGLLFVELLEKGVAEGDVAGDFSAVLTERVKLLYSFPFGPVTNHLCSEMGRCYSLL